MKLPSNVYNRCRLVCVKFYLNRISFAVVIAKCLGGSLFWDTLYYTLFCVDIQTYCIYELHCTVDRHTKFTNAMLHLRHSINFSLLYLLILSTDCRKNDVTVIRFWKGHKGGEERQQEGEGTVKGIGNPLKVTPV